MAKINPDQPIVVGMRALTKISIQVKREGGSFKDASGRTFHGRPRVVYVTNTTFQFVDQDILPNDEVIWHYRQISSTET